MGVHDYRCSVCGEPASFECGEDTGAPCEETGFGNDEAVLDLFFFAAPEAPDSPEAFEQARGRARRFETKAYGYDWGDWEFQPSLNYRYVLMGQGDPVGVWTIPPYEERMGTEGHPVSLDIPAGERVWVVNYCPPCHALFAEGTPSASAPCLEYLSAVADHLGMEAQAPRGRDGKGPFIQAVRQRVARRRPVRP
ncbi:hypothetical protein [Archangium primigenium]|uniref:hypothetical protein n=1 Tax=[Archangium] primigenium TaxID=2792470 RepID=UPI0019563E87|nr:hypothetical protein [Archangium primigenium]MBM7115390.1 hypothetical protein [Archangium primigenium]